IAALRPAVFDRQILALDVAGFAQSLTERGQRRGTRTRRAAAEETDHRHRRLLRSQTSRRGQQAAHNKHQLAAGHDCCLATTKGVRVFAIRGTVQTIEPKPSTKSPRVTARAASLSGWFEGRVWVDCGPSCIVRKAAAVDGKGTFVQPFGRGSGEP